MSYRPITDMWILARPKLLDGKRYYGAYPAGFLERARALLGVNIFDPVLHVCGGLVRYYPYYGGFGSKDKTLDLDPETEPDFLWDARDEYPTAISTESDGWQAIIADPPYSEEEAKNYNVDSSKLPTPNIILKRSLEVLREGGRVGILAWYAPTCPKNGKFIAAIGVMVGFNNRIRLYSVYEKRSQ